ncbi:MAG TPA: hypothetical protein VIL74_23070 [Pyrinomonadaceae bacterium]|jgi:hypothetical protein
MLAESLFLSSFLKIVDRFIDLLKRREEVDKKLYTDFVAPAFADFETVHKNYIDSFLEYRKKLSDRSIPVNQDHPVFEDITRDILFTWNIRVKTESLDHLRDDDLVGKFAASILDYMNGTRKKYDPEKQKLFMESNRVRSPFLDGLRELFASGDGRSQEETRRLGLEFLDDSVKDVQLKYGDVLREHEALKRRLLFPK